MRFTRLASALTAAFCVQTAHAQIVIEKVLDTDTLIPDASGDTFAGVDEPPSLSNGTVLASLEIPSVSGFVEGIFSATTGGTIVEFARTGGAFPDGAGTVDGFGSRGFDISGGNVLISPRRNSSSVRTITTVVGGTPQTIVEHGVTPIPDGSGNFFNDLGDTDPLPLSGENFVFEDTSTTNGIYAYLNGSLVTIAQSGGASPDGNTYISGFDEPDIDGTNIVFEAWTDASQGIFGVIGGAAITAASTDDTVPGQIDNFTFLDNPQIVGSTLTFNADSASVGEGIYTVQVSPTVGSIVKVVEEGDAVPGLTGQTFSDIDEAGLGLDGDLIVFEGSFGGGEEGLFALFNGTLINIIDSTQTLDGKAIDSFGFDSEGVDGNQVAFEVRFDNGSEGIYLATIPEPASAALLGLGGLLVSRRRRRRG